MRVHPAMVPVAPPAGVGARLVQRGVHRGRRGRRADALRPRRRRRARPRRRCSATSSTRPRTSSSGRTGRHDRRRSSRKPIRPIDEVESQFYLLLEVADRPGVLARDRGQFGAHGVSIKSMQQRGIGDDARLDLHHPPAREADLRATLARAARRRRGPPGRLGRCGSWARTTDVSATRRRWPGLIEAYREHLPVTDATPVVTLLEGNTPLARRAAHRRAGRASRGCYLKVEGAEPHRVVQGPRDDDGDLEGGRATAPRS